MWQIICRWAILHFFQRTGGTMFTKLTDLEKELRNPDSFLGRCEVNWASSFQRRRDHRFLLQRLPSTPCPKICSMTITKCTRWYGINICTKIIKHWHTATVQQHPTGVSKSPKTPMGQMLIELDFKAASSKHGQDRTTYLGFERSSMV